MVWVLYILGLVRGWNERESVRDEVGGVLVVRLRFWVLFWVKCKVIGGFWVGEWYNLIYKNRNKKCLFEWINFFWFLC